MIWRFRKLEPSLSSIKEKSLESRRVRTQPCTNIGATGAVRFNASLTEVGDNMAEGGRSNGHTQAPAMQTTARILPQTLQRWSGVFEDGMTFRHQPPCGSQARHPQSAL